jgi:hypothetical protein
MNGQYSLHFITISTFCYKTSRLINKIRKMLKLSATIIRRTPSKATILKADDDSTITTEEIFDNKSSITSSAPSSLHCRDSLGIQAEANQQSSSEDTKLKNNVSFGDITIRDYPMIMGGSVPGCGVPLTLDWEAESEVVLKVEDYEKYRPERRRSRAMYMPPDVRLNLAIRSGFTMREAGSVISECKRIRKERTSSLHDWKWSRISKVMRTPLIFKKNVSRARSA